MATTTTADQLQFVHFWRFEVQSTFSMRDADNFSTTYGPRMYEWSLSVEPTIRAFNTRLPPESSCTFYLVLVDQLTNRVLLKARSQSCPVVDDPHGNRGYYCPQNSDLGVTLQKMLRGNEYFGHVCELTTTLNIPASSFNLDEIENVAPRPPSVPDYRFRMLLDRSRLDFTIRCRDGDIIVAKEGVFLASEYFRDYFAAQPDHKDANFGDVNKQAVMIDHFPEVFQALTFTLTGTMAPPPTLTPLLVNDIIETARRLRALNFPKLRNSLEAEAVKWAMKSRFPRKIPQIPPKIEHSYVKRPRNDYLNRFRHLSLPVCPHAAL
ncbi:unnamed protein product [Nippostrongylus brasiliensis]|uniref:BTB domain-containing protein n=1 Tax=Nippostrongylus brasiliensis TaxID=27835 RepID=A0A0N4YMY1_NIPBR|nr:unnamed protein product [Nippostrongylus brasiliensis]